MDVVIEVFFLFDIILNFFEEFRNEELKPVREIKLIALRYVRSTFIVDVLATIPFRFFDLTDYDKNNRLFFILKLLRCYKLKELMDTKNF